MRHCHPRPQHTTVNPTPPSPNSLLVKALTTARLYPGISSFSVVSIFASISWLLCRIFLQLLAILAGSEGIRRVCGESDTGDSAEEEEFSSKGLLSSIEVSNNRPLLPPSISRCCFCISTSSLKDLGLDDGCCCLCNWI